MSVKFQLFSSQLEFHEDLKKYFDILCSFQLKQDELEDSFKKLVGLEKEPKDIFQILESNVGNIINDLISELSGYGIYDSTQSDFLNTNSGYLGLLQSTTNYYSYVSDISKQHTEIAKSEMSILANDVSSQIHGLDYGIISSNIIAHMIYQIQNEAEVRRQTETAQRQYNEQCELITKITNQQIIYQQKNYYISEYKNSIKESIAKLFTELLVKYLKQLDNFGEINLKCIEGIDIQRSNELLRNISVVKDKEQLLEKAIEICPYNTENYLLAYNNNLLNQDMIKIVQYFGIEEKVVSGILIYEKYEESFSGEILKVYKRLERSFLNIAYIEDKDKMEVAHELMIDSWKHIEEKMIELSKAFSSDEELYFFINKNVNNITNETFESEIEKYIKDFLPEEDIVCLVTNCGFNVYDEASKIFTAKFHKYEELYSYLIDFFKTRKATYISIQSYEEEKKIHQIKELEKQQQLEKELIRKAKNRKLVHLIIAAVILSISLLSGLYKDSLYRDDYNKMYAQAKEEFIKMYPAIVEHGKMNQYTSDIETSAKKKMALIGYDYDGSNTAPYYIIAIIAGGFLIYRRKK